MLVKSVSSEEKIVDLGIFSLGISYFLYSFLQYLFTPFCWWLSRRVDSLAWMDEVFEYFDIAGLEIFSSTSVKYSVLGLLSFFFGYLIFPEKLAKTKRRLLTTKWNLKQAEMVGWVLFSVGFAIKILKILSGIDVAMTVSANIAHTLVSSPLVSFLLSFNWFHLIAFIIFNILRNEAITNNYSDQKRLRLISYFINTLTFFASGITGGLAATLFPLLSLLIIQQYYRVKRISLLKFIVRIAFGLIAIIFTKYLLVGFFGGEEQVLDPVKAAGFRVVFFYILFHRVNMSAVVAAVVEKGQQCFPGGTLNQFWIDMGFFHSDKGNFFDGNDFGRAMGVAGPEDFVTGVAATNMGDLFINFDLLGILIGMFLTGVLYKVLFSNCQKQFPLFMLLYAEMWPILIHGMESPITVLYSTGIKMVLFCVLVHSLIIFKFDENSNMAAGWGGETRVSS